MFLIPLAILALIVLGIVAVAKGGREADPTGMRPYAIYLFAVSFLTLFTVMFSASAVVSALVRAAVGNGAAPGSFLEYESAGMLTAFDSTGTHIREAVQAALVALGAALVFIFHARRVRELDSGGSFAEGPSRHTYQVYLYAVCFVAILTVLVAGIAAAFGLVDVVAPDTGFGPGFPGREHGIAEFAGSGVLAVFALVVFQWHWRRTSQLRLPPPAAAPSEGPPPS